MTYRDKDEDWSRFLLELKECEICLPSQRCQPIGQAFPQSKIIIGPNNSGFERISGQTLIYSLPRVNGHTAWCVYWWTHQKRYNLTVCTGGCLKSKTSAERIYIPWNISFQRVFSTDPLPPLRLLVPAADRFFISVCADSTLLCVSVQPKTVLG